MNEIVSKPLLAIDKFMPKLHLKQRGFSSCGPFTKNKEIIKKLGKQEIHNISIKMYQIKLDFNMI